MARLAWDQTFLDSYSEHRHSPAVLETSSSDSVLLSYTSDLHNNISFYQNFNSNPFLDNGSDETTPADTEVGRIYQNLLCFHNYINTNLTIPCILGTQECALNHMFKIRKTHKKLKSANLNVHSDNRQITMGRLKHLFEEINRKKTSQSQDNTYLTSSHLISSYCNHSNLHKAQHASKHDCSCLEMKFSELKNIEQFLPPLSILPGSQSSLQLSKKYGLFEILRNSIEIAKTHKNTDSKPEYVNSRDVNTGDKSIERGHKSKESFTEKELHILKVNFILLLQSGFYHGRISSDKASDLLLSKPVGTFFLRDSSNPNYLLSLSFKTIRGPTSIRILFQDHLFSLETDLLQDHLKAVPRCNSILRLIQHFVQNPNENTLEESSGRCDTPLLLQSPLVATPPSLAHLARLQVNHSDQNSTVPRTKLKSPLEDYLKQYPYCI